MMARMSEDTTRFREKLAELEQAELAAKLVLNNEGYAIIHGLVVGLTPEWVVLQMIADSVHFDGFGFYRLSEIDEVYQGAGAAGNAYLQRAIDQLGRPPVPFQLPADASIRDLIAIASKASTLLWVTIKDESAETSAVGKVKVLHQTGFDFQQIDANGVWQDTIDAWEYENVMAVDVCTRYLDALAEFGDPLPPQRE